MGKMKSPEEYHSRNEYLAALHRLVLLKIFNIYEPDLPPTPQLPPIKQLANKTDCAMGKLKLDSGI